MRRNSLFFIYTVISTVTVNVKYSVTVNVKCNLSLWPVQVVEWKKLLRSLSPSTLIKKKQARLFGSKHLRSLSLSTLTYFSFLFTLPSTPKPMPVNAKDNDHWPLFFSLYPVNAKANANCKIKVSCQQNELYAAVMIGWMHSVPTSGAGDWGSIPCQLLFLSLIHIWRCRRSTLCRSRWSPYH